MDRLTPVVAVIAAALVGGAAVAQDQEVFEYETFLDPRVLTTITAEGPEYYTYSTSHLRMGYVDRYQFRDELFPSAWFYDWSSTIVLRQWQGTGRVTLIDGDRGVDGRRIEFELGYYWLWNVPAGEAETVGDGGATRFQMSLGLDRPGSGAASDSFGFDAEWTSVRVPGIVVGASYQRTNRVDERILAGDAAGRDAKDVVHRFSLHGRSYRYERHGVSFNGGLALGADWHESVLYCCAARLELQLSRRLGSAGRVFLAYSPSYRTKAERPEAEGYNGELALFLDYKLGTSVTPSGR